MTSLWLHLQAPFAAFRWMQAGVWRATSPIIPPSAAWGLVLNLAGIETRETNDGVTTLVRSDAPVLDLAIGTKSTVTQTSTLYQQLHSYPVGGSGKELKASTHGSKYWIAPVRREVLVEFDAVLGVRAEQTLLSQIVDGLHGRLTSKRYGLPFAGDNNFLFSRIEVLTAAPPVHWYTPLLRTEGQRPGSCRLAIGIDRSDSSRTTTALFAPTTEPTPTPPDEAWVCVPRAAG